MLNEAFKLIRLFHGKTQRELAEELAISISYLSELEAGNRRINLEIISKYSEVFHIPASSLLLFSEQLEAGKGTEKMRVAVAKKITTLMKWVAKQGMLDHEEGRKEAR
ncbi:MAG: helix-turn-helix transcriptional regulator [Alphaproteobacteria bacterium]|nr:helix-turn-helix transcriptional regulator [Alphaproteobacteria bacterium]